jgi:hypothetical protein
LIIPEPEHAYAALCQLPLSLPVTGRLIGHRMAAAVELDREAGLRAVEVQNESAQRMLAAELPSAQPSTAQARPEPHLGIGRHVPHVARMSSELSTVLSHATLTPAPLPFRERG